MNPPTLILASTSRYRAALLARLGVPFQALPPGVDESALAGESAETLAQRLANAKAQALADHHLDTWILGSDQAVACDGRLLGKPGNRSRAIEQLHMLSGREASFLTGVALIKGPQKLQALDRTVVRFRTLTTAEIERYLAAEPAEDCAGSFKSEGLGISLCERIDSDDPTGLIGLPLIAVAKLLRSAGYSVP